MSVTIGKNIDALFKLRKKIAIANKKLDDMKHDETDLKVDVRNQLHELGLDSAKGVNATVSLKKTIIAEVVDRKKVWAYIMKNKAFDMLQFRVSSPAYRERLDSGKKVPGLKPFTKHDLSITKR